MSSNKKKIWVWKERFPASNRGPEFYLNDELDEDQDWDVAFIWRNYGQDFTTVGFEVPW